MDAMAIAFTVLGIAVSIVTFLIGYRSTIGARKERVRSGNDEVEKILVRRIVLENFEPTLDEIVRIVDAKARDFRVRPTDLLSEGQFLNNIYTRVVESDFIPREQRQEILERLGRTIDEMNRSPSLDQSIEEIATQAFTTRMTSTALPALAAMAASATAAGTIFAVLPNFPRGFQSLSEVWPLLFATAATSLALIAFIVVTYRLRERQQEEPSKSAALSSHMEFENEVFRMLKDCVTGRNKRIQQSRSNKGYDYDIEDNGKRIIVEVKNWNRRASHSLFAREVSRLEGVLAEEDATMAILVVPRRTNTNLSSDHRERIKIMTPRDYEHSLESGLTHEPVSRF